MSVLRRENSIDRSISCSPTPGEPVIRYARAFSQGRFPEPYPRGVTPNPIYTDPVTSKDRPRQWKVFDSVRGWRILKIFNKVGIGSGIGSPGVGSARL